MRRVELAPKGPRRWVKWAAVIAGTVVGLYAAAFSFAVLNDGANPQAALLLRPGLPRAAAQAGDLDIFAAGQAALEKQGVAVQAGVIPPSVITGLGLDLSPEVRGRLRAFALTGLTSTPLSSPAVRQLAFLERDMDKRRELLALAERVTKRDVMATLQLAELQLRRNDIHGGLAGLDRTLVVSRTVDPAVFPILLGGAELDAGFRRLIGKRLTEDPVWGERLVRWALANPKYLPTLSRMIANLPAGTPARAVGYGQQMIESLAGEGNYAEAFAAYRAYSPRKQEVADLTRGTFTPLDWRLIDNYNSGSQLFGEDAVEVFANPARQGEVAQIVTALEPGQRQLRLRIAEAVGRGADLRLAVSCLQGTSVLPEQGGTVPLKDGVAAFSFAILASGCDYQRLTLSLAAQNEAAGAIIRSAALVRGRAPGAR